MVSHYSDELSQSCLLFSLYSCQWCKSVSKGEKCLHLILAKRIRGYCCSDDKSELLLLNDIINLLNSPKFLLTYRPQYALWWQEAPVSQLTKCIIQKFKGGQSWNSTFHDTKLSWSEPLLLFFGFLWFLYPVLLVFQLSQCFAAHAPLTLTWSSSFLPRCHHFFIINLPLKLSFSCDICTAVHVCSICAFQSFPPPWVFWCCVSFCFHFF